MRPFSSIANSSATKFQSTHPAWGATTTGRGYVKQESISIHAPRVGCDINALLHAIPFYHFNPRTPRGVRLIAESRVAWNFVFQSTHPAWGATYIPKRQESMYYISIHAPRVGCDKAANAANAENKHFNPRTPRGVRPPSSPSFNVPVLFQSTHPAWGATERKRDKLPLTRISIHAPRVGCDADSNYTVKWEQTFQSTHPAWGATDSRVMAFVYQKISIHAPRVGCDRDVLHHAAKAL